MDFRALCIAILGMIMNSSVFASSISVDPEHTTCNVGDVKYPSIGFGTYRFQEKVCTDAVKHAIQSGYQIIDTATFYENFEAIGEALKTEDRSAFYLISKVWPEDLSRENVRNDLNQTLQKLKTSYLDAYLIHWPNHRIPIKETLEAMEELRQEKKIRHIGLSNVTVNHLKKALAVGVPITWVQIEMHPHFMDEELLKFCKEQAIIVQAWRPLNLGRIVKDSLLEEIGKKYKKTACQVALRWIVQHGCVPLPASRNQRHIQENMDVLDFSLTKEEMQTIDERAKKGSRFRLTLDFGLGFADEFDFSDQECWPNP